MELQPLRPLHCLPNRLPICPCPPRRLAGDRYVFLEYGPMELDLNLRVSVCGISFVCACSI